MATGLFLSGVLWDARQRRIARQGAALEALARFVVDGLKSFAKPALAPTLGGWGFEALLVSMRLHAAFRRGRDQQVVLWLAATAVAATGEESKVERHATLEHLVYAAGLLVNGDRAARGELAELMAQFPPRASPTRERRSGYRGFIEARLGRFLGNPELSERSLSKRLADTGGKLKPKR